MEDSVREVRTRRLQSVGLTVKGCADRARPTLVDVEAIDDCAGVK